MGLCALCMLLADIQKAYCFSIIADEATDVSKREQLVGCVCWVDMNFKFHEDTIILIQVSQTDSIIRLPNHFIKGAKLFYFFFFNIKGVSNLLTCRFMHKEATSTQK